MRGAARFFASPAQNDNDGIIAYKLIRLKQILRERWAELVLLALILAYSAYFSALSIQRHNTFRTHASDLGQMDQALWNTLHGHLLEDTRPNGEQLPRLTDHVEPIFLLVSLSYLIYDGVESILVLQSIVIALGALPIFWIARRKLKSDLAALAFAAMYLLFPALEAANLAEFHAVTLAPAPLLLAYNYGEQGAWKRFALFALIALMVKEEIALLVFMMALWFAVKWQVPSRKGRGTFAPLRSFKLKQSSRFEIQGLPLAIAGVALAWFLVAVFVIVPHFSPAGSSVYLGRYNGVGTSGPAKWIASLPGLVAGIFIPEKMAYLAALLASSGLVALLDPIALVLGLPLLALNLLSNYEAMYSGTYHYSAPVAPYFVLAAIGGAAALSAWIARRGWASEGRARFLVVAPALAIALLYHGMAGYTPLGGEFFWPELTPHDALLARFLNEIPPDAPVSTTASLFPHLSHRRVLYRFEQLPVTPDTQYVLLDVSQVTSLPVDFRVKYLDTLKEGFGVKDAADGYILLERGLTQTELPDEFYSFLRAGGATPQQQVIVDFGNKIRFLGYDVRQDDWGRVYLRTYWTRLPTMEDNNYALFPFYPDANGAPRTDAPVPDLAIHFWYPTMKWKPGEVIIADTVPVDVGARARIGVGVFFGATWEKNEMRLTPRTTAPVSDDGTWALVGELVKEGKRYIVNPSTDR